MESALRILILIKIFARYHIAHLKCSKGKITFSQTVNKSIFTSLNVAKRRVLFFSFHRAMRYKLFINPIVPKAAYSKSSKQALNSVLAKNQPNPQKLKLNPLLIT